MLRPKAKCVMLLWDMFFYCLFSFACLSLYVAVCNNINTRPVM